MQGKIFGLSVCTLINQLSDFLSGSFKTKASGTEEIAQKGGDYSGLQYHQSE